MPMQMKQMEVKSAALKNINISIKDVVEIKWRNRNLHKSCIQISLQNLFMNSVHVPEK